MAIPYSADGPSHSSLSLSRPKTLRSRVSLASLSSAMHKVSSSKPSSPGSGYGQFSKQDGPFRLILNSDRSSGGQPVYSNGTAITGSLDVSQEPSLRSIELKLIGRVKVQEVAGGGASDTAIFSHTFFEWEYSIDPRIPQVVPVNCPIPERHIDEDTGLQHLLPPSYRARHNGVPGFKVRVSYEVVGTFTRARSKASILKKVSVMRMPFVYKPRYSPHTRASSPYMRASPSRSQLRTQEVLSFMIEGKKPSMKPVETRLYLPSGPICLLDEPIPFVIKVFGGDSILDGFAASTPPVSEDAFSSFHPMSSSPPPRSSTSFRRCSKSQQNDFQLKLELRRTTTVDARSCGLVSIDIDSYMSGVNTLAEGVIQSTTRGADWIAWSGQIIIPPEITSGEFSASHLSVSDDLMLWIVPKNPSKSSYVPLCGTTPLTLTPRPHKPPSLNQYQPYTSPSYSQSTFFSAPLVPSSSSGWPSTLSSASISPPSSSSGWPSERKGSMPTRF